MVVVYRLRLSYLSANLLMQVAIVKNACLGTIDKIPRLAWLYRPYATPTIRPQEPAPVADLVISCKMDVASIHQWASISTASSTILQHSAILANLAMHSSTTSVLLLTLTVSSSMLSRMCAINVRMEWRQEARIVCDCIDILMLVILSGWDHRKCDVFEDWSVNNRSG